MNARKILAASLLLAVAATPALAQDDLGAALKRMAASSGGDYVTARQAVTSRKDAKAELEARLAGATWTEASFEELAMATIALAHVAHPETVAKVYALKGVDHEFYRQKRRPDPEVGRELKALGQPAVGAMLEVHLKTFASYKLSDPTTAPGRAASERAALREGLVFALSESKHASAFFVCKAVAGDATMTEGARMLATEGLGTFGTKDALAEILARHGAEGSPESVRLAALRGAARVPTAEALAFLAKRLIEGDLAERKAATVAIGTFGSAWAWASRPEAVRETGEALRAAAAAHLVGAIEREAPLLGESAVDMIAVVAHASSRELLAKLANDGSKSAAVRATAKAALARLEIALERNK